MYTCKESKNKQKIPKKHELQALTLGCIKQDRKSYRSALYRTCLNMFNQIVADYDMEKSNVKI